jgi:hypothetical protein
MDDGKSLGNSQRENRHKRLLSHCSVSASDPLNSARRRFQMSRDENEKSIGHLIRKLRLCKHGGNSLVPPSILRIHHLRTIHIGEVIHIAARAQSSRPSNLREASFSLILEDGGLTFVHGLDCSLMNRYYRNLRQATQLFCLLKSCCIETPNALTCKDAFSFRQSWC